MRNYLVIITTGSRENIDRGATRFGRSILQIFIFGVMVICVFAATAYSQTGEQVRLAGSVVDENGGMVVGAKVVVSTEASKATVVSVTNGNGQFQFMLLPAKYSLKVTATGFNKIVEAVEVKSSATETSAIVLKIATATATVTVSDDAIYSADSTVSSATKTLAPLRDVPQSISVIKKEQIRDQLFSSVADVVQYVPGVSSHQGENNRDEVIIRGNRSNADFYLDGVRDDVQYYRDLYNLDRFEALKGPNAMIFGRGGGGGVINRVTKKAHFAPTREFTAQMGTYYNRRFTGDINQPLGDKVAMRFNGVYENSDSFRKFVNLQRAAFNPTFTFLPDLKTHVTVGYEFSRDRRTADRGITSFQGRPVDVPISTFYGDPTNSHVRANVNILTGTVERLFGKLSFRNMTSYGDYDRMYQNYVPGAVNAAKTLVTLTAYNTATRRRNLFNQTDLNYILQTGGIKHTLAAGIELGNQRTKNFRNTGYFNNLTTSTQVAFDSPQTSVPVTFRQSATDANNHLRLNLGAAYVQDQIEISRFVQIIAGVRYDYFDLKYFNNRNTDVIRRIDRQVSPRFGVVVKPVTALSVYGSYSMSYLPSSGDQFSSLTTVTQQVKPEKFTNFEAGTKWDIRRNLFLTTAIYRLDRTNTRATDPNNPTAIIQTGKQRTNGFELGLTGNILPAWTVSGGYAYQNARITSATTAAIAGKQVGQVPHNTFSLWNRYQLTSKLGAGLGMIYRSEMFATVDNTITIPGYVKADAAVYYNISERWRLQANFENLTNVRYYVNADSNTNISPGGPRGIKVSVVARF